MLGCMNIIIFKVILQCATKIHLVIAFIIAPLWLDFLDRQDAVISCLELGCCACLP